MEAVNLIVELIATLYTSANAIVLKKKKMNI